MHITSCSDVVPCINKDYQCVVSLVGGAPIFLGLPPYPVEVLNDLDSAVSYFFHVLKNHDELVTVSNSDDRTLLASYRRSSETQRNRLNSWLSCGFRLLRDLLKNLGRRKFFNKNRGDFEVFGFNEAKDFYSKLREIDPVLPDFHGRLFRLQLEYYSVPKIIDIYDGPKTLFVVDLDQIKMFPEEQNSLDLLKSAKGETLLFSVEKGELTIPRRYDSPPVVNGSQIKEKRMATKKKAGNVKKAGRTQKSSPKKDGFPTAKQLRARCNSFAEEVGTKILTASKVKELPKTMGLRASADFPEAVAKVVYQTVLKAAKRCVANDRKTLRPDDL